MSAPILFNGHQVRDLREGVYAVISHHISPAVGLIRLNDADGVPHTR